MNIRISITCVLVLLFSHLSGCTTVVTKEQLRSEGPEIAMRMNEIVEQDQRVKVVLDTKATETLLFRKATDQDISGSLEDFNKSMPLAQGGGEEFVGVEVVSYNYQSIESLRYPNNRERYVLYVAGAPLAVAIVVPYYALLLGAAVIYTPICVLSRPDSEESHCFIRT